ncbi:hypothetical protein POVWA2_025240 [Plasmodium ovale wallikeri]|uniref:Uncharacterized protein n=1 Tax=Plasmodium ovale wallikeri TaxID=864142 RepID=A0A1A8YU24_PLAOA|nr:hypothetical protein POVWA1_025420 [Plasmodium ovale wallikeri]SBT35480.1 hypothetical protein POVWA2_025240 [Plasmodium ovale wallikeri]
MGPRCFVASTLCVHSLRPLFVTTLCDHSLYFHISGLPHIHVHTPARKCRGARLLSYEFIYQYGSSCTYVHMPALCYTIFDYTLFLFFMFTPFKVAATLLRLPHEGSL